MSNQESSPYIKNRDFGIAISLKEVSKGNVVGEKKKTSISSKFNFKNFIKNFESFSTNFVRATKAFFTFISKSKRNFARSIFIGRGVYFKYVSNFALLIIVSFGAFVYIGYDKNTSNFISKYSGVSASNSGVLFNPGGQSFIAQKQTRITQYTVQPGDTLSTIAAKYSTEDNKITVDTIMWANNLSSSDLLKTGMKLDILPVAGVLHTVKKGDTVFSIAQKYKLLSDKSSVEEITGVTQKITDINYLDIKVVQSGASETRIPELIEGQRIIIPGGIKIAEAPKVITRAPSNTLASGPSYVDIGPAGVLGWPVAGPGIVTQGWKPWHRAVDVANASQPNLVAMDNGVVTSFGYIAGSSCAIGIKMTYSSGYSSLYCHLSSLAPGLSKGMPVSKGQVIGRMGCTGVCTGTHVHVEIKKNGVNLNPCLFDVFKGKGDCA